MTNPSRILHTTGVPKKQMWHGIYQASVVNTNDPANEGRVTLRVPQVLGTAVSNWARALGYSPILVPSPGTMVHAYFTGGDINFPIYIYTGGIQTEINNLLPGTWQSMSLLNSWTNTSGKINAKYRTVNGGDSVEIIGNLTAGNANDNTTLATLPAGFYNTSHSHSFNADVTTGAQSSSVSGTVSTGSLQDGTVSQGILPVASNYLVPTSNHTISSTPFTLGPGGTQWLSWDFNTNILDSVTAGQQYVQNTSLNSQTSTTVLNLNSPTLTIDTSGNIKITNCPNAATFSGGISFHQTIPLSV